MIPESMNIYNMQLLLQSNYIIGTYKIYNLKTSFPWNMSYLQYTCTLHRNIQWYANTRISRQLAFKLARLLRSNKLYILITKNNTNDMLHFHYKRLLLPGIVPHNLTILAVDSQQVAWTVHAIITWYHRNPVVYTASDKDAFICKTSLLSVAQPGGTPPTHP